MAFKHSSEEGKIVKQCAVTMIINYKLVYKFSRTNLIYSYEKSNIIIELSQKKFIKSGNVVVFFFNIIWVLLSKSTELSA